MKVLYVLLFTVALAYAQSINGSASGGIGANGTGGQVATEIQGGNPPKNENKDSDYYQSIDGDQPGQGQPGGNGQGQGQPGGNGQGGGGAQGQFQGQIGGGGGNGGGGSGGGGSGQGGASFSGTVSSNGLGQGILSALDGIAGGFVKGVQSIAEPFVTAENAICVGLDNVMADLIRNGNYSGQNYVFSVGGKVVSQGQIRGGNKRKSNAFEKALKDLKKHGHNKHSHKKHGHDEHAH